MGNTIFVVTLDVNPNFALIWPIMLVNDSDYRLYVFLLLSYSCTKKLPFTSECEKIYITFCK
ncbi:hypothetical protein XCR1_1170029 [Xenorhabdus cabanillasii JM26]|uniref:Uncharacterized protein n=1 Tax=Xenorhabdus cabanillasii JM26 TaxID=1427517 RepID=W1IM33_9GAMM|nr:hypothetical protein XCR1_1170029 [Xenorhabdus cabanillasii JM26]